MFVMPVCEIGQTVSQRVDLEGRGVGDRIVRDALDCRWQQSAPSDLEVANRRGVTALRILALRSLQIELA